MDVALGGEGGEDQRGAGAQVADLDLRAVEGRRPVIVAWCASTMSIRAPIRRSSASHSRRSSKIVSWIRDVPVAWVSSTHVGGWRSVARPGYGAVSMSTARNPPSHSAVPSTSIVSAVAVDRHAGPLERLEERAQVVARRALERDPAAGHGGRRRRTCPASMRSGMT